jgi:replicative DNA helicase
MSDQTLPDGIHDTGAEQAVLGAMLLSRAAISDVMEIVKGGDFYQPIHQTIFDVTAGMHSLGEPVDALLVGKALADSGDLLRVGGVPYLHTLIASVPTVGNATHYARIVADHATLRALDEACLKVRQMVHSRRESPADLVETARAMVAELAGRAASADGPVAWSDIVTEGLDAAERTQERHDRGETSGIPTGFPDLDRLIHGLQPGQVYVVAGESGSGKSTLATDIVRSTAFVHGEPTLYYALEMSRVEMFNRLVCAHAGVMHDKLAAGTMGIDDWTKIGRICGETDKAPLYIDESGRLSVADIRVRALKIKRERDLKVIVVDLIGLVAPDASNSTREQQVASISRKLHALAKELGVAIVVVAQINRGPQARADKRPVIHDLRESAQIGHDAAVVILVFRPDKADRNTDRLGEADLIIDKNRFGAETTITVAAQLHYSRFVSMARAA